MVEKLWRGISGLDKPLVAFKNHLRKKFNRKKWKTFWPNWIFGRIELFGLNLTSIYIFYVPLTCRLYFSYLRGNLFFYNIIIWSLFFPWNGVTNFFLVNQTRISQVNLFHCFISKFIVSIVHIFGFHNNGKVRMETLSVSITFPVGLSLEISEPGN